MELSHDNCLCSTYRGSWKLVVGQQSYLSDQNIHRDSGSKVCYINLKFMMQLFASITILAILAMVWLKWQNSSGDDSCLCGGAGSQLGVGGCEGMAACPGVSQMYGHKPCWVVSVGVVGLNSWERKISNGRETSSNYIWRGTESVSSDVLGLGLNDT